MADFTTFHVKKADMCSKNGKISILFFVFVINSRRKNKHFLIIIKIMRKLFLFLAAAVISVSASAQFEGNKFSDNWSLGFNVGSIAPVKDGDFLKNQRFQGGVELTKQWTPILATSLDVRFCVNATPSTIPVDIVTEMLNLKWNLTNLFLSYKGVPRAFEVEAVTGVGIGETLRKTKNSKFRVATFAASRLGLNFNFNLGESKAWTLSFKPALVYNLDGRYFGKTGHDYCKYTLSAAAAELTAGLTYHFMNSNNHRYFTNVRPYDQGEVDALNARINALRNQANELDTKVAAQAETIKNLERMLNDERDKKPVVVKESVVVTEKGVDTKTLETVVTYRKGKSTIDASQLPNVERIASYLKHHSDAKVSIKGYASPEGSAKANERIAAARAEAVKTMLVNKYGIAADRISATGQGVGNLFSEPDWNRVSISTIEESK